MDIPPAAPAPPPVYGVQGLERKTPPPGPEATAARPRRVAVLVAHGMGQQIPYQTLDQVAEGLRRDATETRKPLADTVRQGDQWLHRIRLGLQGTRGEVRADVYEAYWAPLTEGRITIRDVIGFLVSAGWHGILNGSQDFRRWMFGGYACFRSPIRIVLYLLAGLLALLSLVLMNTTIAVVVAGRSLMNDSPPRWLNDALFRDLTTTFNFVVTALALLAVALLIARGLRWLRLRGLKSGRPGPLGRGWVVGWGGVTVAAFVFALAVVTLCGAAIVLLFLGHATGGAAPGEQLWQRILGERVDGFNRAFDATALALAVAFLAWLVVGWAVKIAGGIVRELHEPRHRWLTLLAAGFLLVVGVLAVVLALGMLGLRLQQTAGAAGIVASGLAWPALVLGSALIRRLLVQYMGDVAIYVRPYKLDRYYQLRDDIRQCALRTARAIYERHEDEGPYDEVVVVAHSLGSVVAYDVLNRLLLEDEADGRKLGVARRTGLLLTYGSPLDKTAFIFAVQGRHSSEGRGALTATVQPLIMDYAFRPARWVNVWSPWDVISGPLGFYDPEDGNDPKRVENRRDPEATTLLAAHVEYEESPLLYEVLREQVLRGD